MPIGRGGRGLELRGARQCDKVIDVSHKPATQNLLQDTHVFVTSQNTDISHIL